MDENKQWVIAVYKDGVQMHISTQDKSQVFFKNVNSQKPLVTYFPFFYLYIPFFYCHVFINAQIQVYHFFLTNSDQVTKSL